MSVCVFFFLSADIFFIRNYQLWVVSGNGQTVSNWSYCEGNFFLHSLWFRSYSQGWKRRETGIFTQWRFFVHFHLKITIGWFSKDFLFVSHCISFRRLNCSFKKYWTTTNTVPNLYEFGIVMIIPRAVLVHGSFI